uniref:Uncharacterized protein n=1 Tax=viral metagenome TaxID=1070528 RepID=A0A6M3KJZ5_9ZZZZ
MGFEVGYKPMRTKNKVYIIGCGATKDLAEMNDPDGEYWGVNNLCVRNMPFPWSRWFEIHDIWKDDKQGWLRRGSKDFRGQQVIEYLKDLQKLNIPVYMQKPNEIVTNAVPYPLVEIKAQFGDYLTNSISMMIGLALYERFEEILMYGVEMQHGTEYYGQKPSVEYWVGLALGMGKKFHIPDESDLLKTKFTYGFEEQRDNRFRKRMLRIKKNLIKEHDDSKAKYKKHEKVIIQTQSAMQTLDMILSMWNNQDDDKDFINN